MATTWGIPIIRIHLPTTCDTPTCRASSPASDRPTVRGKFLFAGPEKLYVRGVTYGTFRPDSGGLDYPDPAIVASDFAQMAASGINAVRVYTVPPRWLLDLAWTHGLRLLVGLPWEQHVAFLDDAARAQDIEQRVRAGVQRCAGHPAVLCYAIGNEIPASIVRWHGRERVERFLLRLFEAVKQEDPGSLVTYVNYPSTEYLDLPFVDIVAFNVYLEHQPDLDAYLARLQNVAGDRPLLMAEVGFDSHRHGEDAQSQSLRWQVQTSFAAGCSGIFVFAWTDEWHRGGYDIHDWDFGLTDRDRRPKPALAAVQAAYAEAPFPADLPWPRISVVVCSYNGARTIPDCLAGLRKLRYPNVEVIVVDDGSTDDTAAIARDYGFRVISTENRGLSSARNTGLAAATGEIVAYTDDDAWPDPDWLTYLASAFMQGDYAGVGGPNIPPPGDGCVAQCVAKAPGGPMHVLLSDREAEHIPGCNMAFRRDALLAVGGFDTRFRVAGDDVDICWQMQARGWKLGFSPAAMVWHHRRNSIRAYWKQQRGYGRAEALLEQKWPEKYNMVGHPIWAGRLYAPSVSRLLGWTPARIYHGTWGSGAFQSVAEPASLGLGAILGMPEWFALMGVVALLGMLGIFWPALAGGLLVAAAGLLASVIHAQLVVAHLWLPRTGRRRGARPMLRGVILMLHLVQPVARLVGRLESGLTPWRRPEASSGLLPRARQGVVWSESWHSAEEWLHACCAVLRTHGAALSHGSAFDRWDLEVGRGAIGRARVRLAIEEHGGGRQLVRLRAWPRFPALVVAAPLALVALSVLAARDGATPMVVTILVCALLLAWRAVTGSAGAVTLALAGLAAAPAVLASEDDPHAAPADALLGRVTVALLRRRATSTAAPTATRRPGRVLLAQSSRSRSTPAAS